MATTTRVLDANVNGTVYTSNANAALEALDTCHSGATAPTDEVANGKLWLDTSTTPGILKIYNNAAWEVVGKNWTPSINDNAAATAVTIDAIGNVGIGTSSIRSVANYRTVSVGGGTNGALLDMVNVSGAVLGAIYSGNDGSVTINADPNGAFASSGILFQVDGTERCRLDSLGNLLVGKAATAFGTAGVELRSTGGLWSTVTNGGSDFNRLGTDGVIQTFWKDGSTVGSIGTSGGDVYLRKSSGSGVYCSSTAVLPFGAHSLGQPSDRWSDLYLSGGVYLGGTAAANKLDDYEEGTWTPRFTFSGNSVGMTFTTQYGAYTKVGRSVTATAVVKLSNKGTSSGFAEISGLPFTSVNETNSKYSGACYPEVITFADMFISVMNPNTSSVSLREVTNAGALTVLTNSDFANTSGVVLTITYNTA